MPARDPRSDIFFGLGLNAQLGDRDQATQLGRPLIDRPTPAQLVKNIARIAEKRRSVLPPVPMYVKPADAAPHAIYPQRC